MSFDTGYELEMHALKADFLACRQWELLCSQAASPDAAQRLVQQGRAWRQRLAALRETVHTHFELFDARRVSSLLALPTRALDELLLHRIWMGGALPDGVRQAICQWGAALEEVDGAWRSVLWVWDAAQLAGDPLFRPGQRADGDTLGRYTIGGHELDVRSVAALIHRCAPLLAPRLAQWHAAGCYVNLSDYLRILVLREHGGMYLDADTMPYRGATVFLARPETPDYVSFDSVDGHVSATHVSWLNLVRDENGLLVARRGDAAVRELADEMAAALAAISPFGVPDPRLLQQATYYRWRRHAGSTLLSWHDLMQAHSVLADPRPEAVVAGVRGMRLRTDGDTGAPQPLSQAEALRGHAGGTGLAAGAAFGPGTHRRTGVGDGGGADGLCAAAAGAVARLQLLLVPVGRPAPGPRQRAVCRLSAGAQRRAHRPRRLLAAHPRRLCGHVARSPSARAVRP